VVNETVLGEAAAYIGFYDVNVFNKLELQWGTFSIVSLGSSRLNNKSNTC